ncbi:HmuY family protein [Psychroserpens luteus]|uniref:HmuY family protein n=1 Tax=Psychroserpens luteus TaxID=1434066 RepID=A0ABW6A1H3_9FLAO|nr:HmuY family protein [Psychroserpens luteus]
MSINTDHKKKGSKLNWIIGIFISVLAAGGGISALLEYNDSIIKKDNKDFEKEMVAWENFSPESLSLGVQSDILLTNAPFDLDKGSMTNGAENQYSDLVFGCWPQGKEFLRAPKGVTWSDQGVMNFENIKYRKIRDAKFGSSKYLKFDHYFLFIDDKSNVPRKNHVYFVKTNDGNIAKIQIVDYISGGDPRRCRKIKIKYEVFPIVKDPPKPKR